MIGKIMPHQKEFGPLAGYLLYGRDRQSPERVEWLAMRNLDGATPETAHLIMQATATKSKRVQKPRQHLIVSWAQGDQPTDEQMIAIVDKTLKDLGLSEHQAMYVAHNDADHQHVHAIINRVHPDTGRAAKDGNERHKLRRSLVQQEQLHGLTQTPLKSRGRHQLRTFSEIEIAGRTNTEELMRFSKRRCEQLREDLAYCFKTAGSWSSLDSMFSRRGYKLTLSGRGVRLVKGASYAKLSDVLPPKLTAKRLTERWGRFGDYWAKQHQKSVRQKRKQRQKEQEAQHQK